MSARINPINNKLVLRRDVEPIVLDSTPEPQQQQKKKRKRTVEEEEEEEDLIFSDEDNVLPPSPPPPPPSSSSSSPRSSSSIPNKAAPKSKAAASKRKSKRDRNQEEEADSELDAEQALSESDLDEDDRPSRRDRRMASIDSSESDDEIVKRRRASSRGKNASSSSSSSSSSPFSSSFALQSLPSSRDFRGLSLRADHERRPIWVCPNGRVYLDTRSAIYQAAYDFLIAISDPVCRPQFIHEYQITSYSLYAAASLGLGTADILSGLRRLSKLELAPALVDFVTEKTLKCGKVKLVLKRTRYFVESIHADVLQELLAQPEIAAARIDQLNAEELRAYEQALQQPASSSRSWTSSLADEPSIAADQRDALTGFLLSNTVEGEEVFLAGIGKADQRRAMGLIDLTEMGDAPTSSSGEQSIESELEAPSAILAFEIHATQVEQVRRVCNEISYPVLEEYDFRRDSSTPDLPIHLKPEANIREYQEKSLSKMFGNGRARSGIIVLPCGAGKTLVGITAAATIKKSTLVFCTTGVAVDQWRRQFLQWSSLPASRVLCFTSSLKDKIPSSATSLVLITTYNMVSFSGKRSAQADEIMSHITTQEWGLVICDEVHVAPAKMFRKCVSITHSRAKLGLTATLVREDNLVDDLYYLIGPKLYEANWLDLQTAGFIATVQCVEVWCDMTPEFYASYLSATLHKQMLLYVMNPNKFRACEYLIRLHEARGDKVLVFSDNVYALKYYAMALDKPLIYGATSDHERLEFLHHFQTNERINTLFISKVGDNSIDLPDVNVIIQISSHFSSRRQEAQRLGRILRPKTAGLSRFNAFFYTLVSKDTREMLYATKRQRFLVDQGYAFKVVTRMHEMDTMSDLKLSTQREQLEVLARVLAVDENEGKVEQVADDPFDDLAQHHRKKVAVQRRVGSALALSGATDRAYQEFERRDAQRKANRPQHALFKQRVNERKG